jgi:type II secretory pathway pseudopilin PulG
MSSLASPRGFTLFETLIATGILVTALAGLAQLFILSTHLTRQANTSGAALAAAQDRLEALVGLPFEYDAAGTPVTDPALTASPPSSLDHDTPPFVDWIDAAGDASASGDGAVFVRRWRVTAIADDAPDAVAVEVCVLRAPADDVAVSGAEACLSTVRTRQP